MSNKYLLILFGMMSCSTYGQIIDSIYQKKTTNLGEITIQARKNTAVISNKTMATLHKENIGEATSLLPSVILSQIGSRNETFVSIRGFGSRSIPIYLDGIPVYIPFDGEIDLARFNTNNITKIVISKGFSPMEYGANTLGGVINLVSNKPQHDFELNAQASLASGQKHSYGFNIGSKKKNYYWQANYNHTQQEYFPLSKDFSITDSQSGFQRNNSYNQDDKMSVKFAYTPNLTDEYTINYKIQTAKKGNPSYEGSDENVRIRYWQWPKWDKQSLYFLSKTKLKKESEIKLRLYHDTFINQLASYDNDTYSSQNFPFAFTSNYHDYSLGGNIVYTNRFTPKQLVNIATHYKYDNHKSHNNEYPVITLADNTWTFGIDYTFNWTSKTDLISGISVHQRSSLQAQEYDFTNQIINNLPKSNNSALNAQVALKHQLNNRHFLQLSIAQKSRFATMKDRYSYRLGRSIPNPNLLSEKATHFELNYQGLTTQNIQLESSIYASLVQNVIQFVTLIESGVDQLQNTGKALFYGFETSIQIPVSKKLNWISNYSIIIQKNTDQPEIKFTDIPIHSLKSVLYFEWSKNLNSSLEASYFSDRYSTSYGTIADAFTVAHINTSYTIKNWTIHGKIYNITDTNYAFSEGYPNAGRMFSIGLRYELNR